MTHTIFFNSGNIENSKWVKIIESVKEKHPKPE